MFLSEADEKALERILPELQLDDDIIGVILFGSALQSKFYHDVDIALVKNVNSPAKPLKYLLKFPDHFDVHFLDEMPIPVAKEAIQGKILLNKDYSHLFDIFMNVINEWEAFRPYYELYLETVKNGL